MRTVMLAVLGMMLAGLLAGCSGIPATQPSVTLPLAIGDLWLVGQTATEPLVKKTIDMSDDTGWAQAERLEAVGLSMQVANTTNDAANPDAASLRVYVSEMSTLTADTLALAHLLFDVRLPAGQQVVHYDSGMVPLSEEAAYIMQDGKFTLYVTGAPNTISVQSTETQLHVKMRTALL